MTKMILSESQLREVIYEAINSTLNEGRVDEAFEGSRGAINGWFHPGEGESRKDAAKRGYANGMIKKADKIYKKYGKKPINPNADDGLGEPPPIPSDDENVGNTQMTVGGGGWVDNPYVDNNENIQQPEAQPETQVQPQATPQYQENSNMRPAGPYGQYYSTQTGNMNYDYQSGNMSQQQPMATRQTRGKTYKANAQGRSNTGNIQSMVPQELLNLGNKALGYIQNGKRQYSTQAQRQFIQQAVPFLQRLAGQ